MLWIISPGKIDEVRIWNEVRSTDEIRQNMFAELSDPGSEGNLVAYYKLNETSNATTAEDSKSTNDGTLIGYVSQTGFWQTSSAFFGPKNCLHFDGSDDYVSLTNSSVLRPTDSLTLECWINPDNWSSSQQNFAGNTHSGGYNFALGSPDVSHIGFAVHSDGSYKRVDADLTGYTGWHHVAGTFDGQYVRLYIDGEMKDELDMGTSGKSIYYKYNNCMILGAEADEPCGPQTGYYYAGKMDEIRFWNVARTDQQIQENMCKNLIGNESGLIAYYNFDNASEETLQDFSGNEIDGTLYNMDNSDWVSSSAFNIWLNTSTSTSNWATASNWSLGSSPNAATENVGIPDYSAANDPEIGSGIEVNNLVVGDNATLTFNYSGSHTIHGSVFNIGTTNLEANTDLTITGSLYMLHNSVLNISAMADLTVQKNLFTTILGLDGTLTIESDATGSGSLIINGSATGDITVQRYLTADKWHYISGQTNITGNFSTLNMGLTGGAGNDQFYRWEEDYNYGGNIGNWVDILNGEDGSGTNSLMDDEGFESCKGYAITYKTGAETLSLSGVPYVGNQNILLKKTTNSTAEGSNLIGNPFCSTIAINDNADADNNFLDQNAAVLDDSYEAIYIWDESEGWNGTSDADYEVYNTTSAAFYASVSQAFMVQAASNDATMYFNTSIRKHGSSVFYKNAESDDVGRLTLYLTSPQNLSNKTSFYFSEGMSKGLDPSYDAAKLKGNPDLALYTKLIEDNGKDFAIQALPYFKEDYSVPVGIDITQEGEYTFEVASMEMIPEHVHIYLEDLKTGIIADMKENSSYTCVLDETGSITDRFFLHFTLTPFGQEELMAKNSTIQVYSHGNTIHVYNPEEKTGRITVFDMMGQSLITTPLTGSIKQSVNLQSPSGFYIVRIHSENKMISKKVIIE